jgi:hypothetical protein
MVVMKITRRQLRKLIREVAVTLSDEEVAAAKQKLKDEGGAAGAQMVAQAVKDTEGDDPDLDDEDVLDALMAADEEIELHADGDVIDVGGLAERKKRKKKKKKKTKSKKKRYLYPYVYGHHDHDFHDYGYDIGFDGGGDGGGGE